MTEEDLQLKLTSLKEALRGMERIVLAYSGGVDSTFLLATAREGLRGDVLAATAVSAIYPKREYDRARAMADFLGVRHVTIATQVLDDPAFSTNPPDRCYHCKRELFRALRSLADAEGIRFIVDGNNLDDCSDYRPGMRAAQDAGVRSPLIEARLSKQEIRTLSKAMNLPTWDIPSMACLASRFPYRERITAEKLIRVDSAENFLRDEGFTQVRVRTHDVFARVEVDARQVALILQPGIRRGVVEELKRLGFSYVTIDLEGYRAGSMNEGLPEKDNRREVEERSKQATE